jgi:hypothetical protein
LCEESRRYFLSDELMISRKPCGSVLAGIIKKGMERHRVLILDPFSFTGHPE